MIVFFIMTGLALPTQLWEKRLRIDNKFNRKEAKEIAKLRTNLDKNLSRVILAFRDSVSDAEVDDFYRLLKKEFPSAEAFNEILKELDLSEQTLKDEIQSELAVFYWIDKVYEETMPKETTTVVVPEERVYREIYIPAPPYANWYERLFARIQAWKVWTILKIGNQPFESVVKRYSHGRTRKLGGIREPIFYMKNNPISEVVFNLKPGEISKPIETRWGFYIVKLEEIRPRYSEKFGRLKFNEKRFVLYNMMKTALEKHLKEQIW